MPTRSTSSRTRLSSTATSPGTDALTRARPCRCSRRGTPGTPPPPRSPSIPAAGSSTAPAAAPTPSRFSRSAEPPAPFRPSRACPAGGGAPGISQFPRAATGSFAPIRTPTPSAPSASTRSPAVCAAHRGPLPCRCPCARCSWTRAGPRPLGHFLNLLDRAKDAGLAEGLLQNEMGPEVAGDPQVRIPRNVSAAGHRNDLNLRVLRANLRDELEPVPLGHQQVGDHDLDLARRQDLGRLDSILRDNDRMAGRLQYHAQQFPNAGLVIDDKDRTGGH